MPAVLAQYAEGIAAAIITAHAQQRAATMHYAADAFADTSELAINRSLAAYNANPEVQPKLAPHEAHKALDSTVKMLQFVGDDGKMIGCINWFGIHTTSLSNDNTLVSADNKGFAADYLEAYLCQKYQTEVIAAFAQDTAGDITPNYVWDSQKKWMRGKFANDADSARHNGQLQFAQAKKIIDEIPFLPIGEAASAQKTLAYTAHYIDFSQLTVAPQFAPEGATDKRTAPSALGIAMLGGTAEGPGAPAWLCRLTPAVSRVLRWWELRQHPKESAAHAAATQKYAAQSPKSIVLEMQARRLLLSAAPRRVIIPAWADLHVSRMKEIDAKGLAEVFLASV